jgi:hypothetical protein
MHFSLQYAGAIIGKGGMRIRRIRADSGAGITIAEPAHGQNERIITITGSQGQIRMAQYLLQQRYASYLTVKLAVNNIFVIISVSKNIYKETTLSWWAILLQLYKILLTMKNLILNSFK